MSILFVHGSQSDRRVWDALIALAPSDTHAVSFDLPDHGTALAQPTPAIEPLREALLAQVKALPEGPVVLVGHSLGAFLIASAAPRFSRPIEHFFLISGYALLHPEDREIYRKMADGLEGGRLDLEFLREMALEVALGERHDRPELHALVAEMQEMPFETAVRSLRRGLEMGPPGASAYDVPTTVIHGRDDAAIRFALSEELANLGTRAELVAFDTDSHLLPLTHPKELAELIFAP